MPKVVPEYREVGSLGICLILPKPVAGSPKEQHPRKRGWREPARYPFDGEIVTARVYGSLVGAECRSWADVRRLDLLTIPNIGKRSFDQIVEILVRRYKKYLPPKWKPKIAPKTAGVCDQPHFLPSPPWPKTENGRLSESYLKWLWHYGAISGESVPENILDQLRWYAESKDFGVAGAVQSLSRLTPVTLGNPQGD